MPAKDLERRIRDLKHEDLLSLVLNVIKSNDEIATTLEKKMKDQTKKSTESVDENIEHECMRCGEMFASKDEEDGCLWHPGIPPFSLYNRNYNIIITFPANFRFKF